MEKLKKTAKKIYRFFVLRHIWLHRIAFAKSYFKVPFFIRLKMIFNGYLPDQYVLFDLKHNPMMDYLSEYDWYKSRYLNGHHRIVLNDKLVCNDIMRSHFTIPKLYCAKTYGKLIDENGLFIKVEDALQKIKSVGVAMLKPVSSGKGKNVFQISYHDSNWYIDGNIVKEIEIKNKLEKWNKWYLSERIEQGEFPKSLYEKTTNTMRIVTIRDPKTNYCKICFAVQRIGTLESIPVDNASRGGICARIDLETGMLSYARSLHVLGNYSNHPETGAQIEGKIIPNWNEIKERVIKTSESFPYLQLIAWDFLLTDDDIYMIEANSSSGINILQLWGGQRKEALGEFFRYHKKVKRG